MCCSVFQHFQHSYIPTSSLFTPHPSPSIFYLSLALDVDVIDAGWINSTGTHSNRCEGEWDSYSSNTRLFSQDNCCFWTLNHVCTAFMWSQFKSVSSKLSSGITTGVTKSHNVDITLVFAKSKNLAKLTTEATLLHVNQAETLAAVKTDGSDTWEFSNLQFFQSNCQ